MKTVAALLALGLLTAVPAQAQSPSDFHGAEATKSQYRVAYQLNSADDNKIKETLRNINNALNDPRLKDKLQAELVVHGQGVAVYRKEKGYEADLAALQKRGVILAMCENTMRVMNISRDELLPFIAYVPSGNGELIIRQQEGWAIVHP
jgi:intracellular sulfur oxidation DsrE/DsrF family protein